MDNWKHKVWVERSQADSAERNESVPFTCHQENWDGDDTAATLVIHDIDTDHERVFTESEVMAILNTFINHLRDGCSVMSGDVRAVARYHGIDLDPA